MPRYAIYESARGFDQIELEDELMKSRKIFLTGGVNSASCNEIIKQLMYLEKQGDNEITLYINSPGGEVISGLAVYDYISAMKAPVRTVCIGTAASMGAIIFLAGQKRQMLFHARLMIHDPSFNHNDIGGKKPHEIQQELDKLNEVREALAKIVAEKTGRRVDEIYKLTADDTYYNAEEAIEFGLATEIYKED